MLSVRKTHFAIDGELCETPVTYPGASPGSLLCTRGVSSGTCEFESRWFTTSVRAGSAPNRGRHTYEGPGASKRRLQSMQADIAPHRLPLGTRLAGHRGQRHDMRHIAVD